MWAWQAPTNGARQIGAMRQNAGGHVKRGMGGAMERLEQRAGQGSDLLWGRWLAFTPGTSEEAARQHFQARYGHEPARALHSLGLTLVANVLRSRA